MHSVAFTPFSLIQSRSWGCSSQFKDTWISRQSKIQIEKKGSSSLCPSWRGFGTGSFLWRFVLTTQVVIVLPQSSLVEWWSSTHFITEFSAKSRVDDYFANRAVAATTGLVWGIFFLFRTSFRTNRSIGLYISRVRMKIASESYDRSNSSLGLSSWYLFLQNLAFFSTSDLASF